MFTTDDFFIVRIEKMPPNTETIQEIRFWLELENELLNIERQLKQPEAGI